MFTHYEDINHYLELKDASEMKMGLGRMQAILEKLGNPEKELSCIHIAGTNGKGSTIQMLQAILLKQGYTVGTFTSPYLTNVREHIQTNGSMIPEEELSSILQTMKPLVRELEREGLYLSEFEAMAAAAFVYFKKKGINLCLIESGLGGRTDATNVITPLLSIITNVGYDHMNILGYSLKEIASHKAGIIKPLVPVITGAESHEALSIIEFEADKNQSRLYKLGMDFTVHISETTSDLHEKFNYESPYAKRDEVAVTLLGKHQVINAGLALMAIDVLKDSGQWKIDESSVYSGLLSASWPGRFERISSDPLVILDGAHNPEGIQALAETLSSHFSDTSIHVVFGALKDKNTEEMLKPLERISSSVTFVSFPHHRAEKAKALFDKSTMKDKAYFEDWHDAIQDASSRIDKKGMLLITGSLYFIGSIRENLVKKWRKN